MMATTNLDRNSSHAQGSLSSSTLSTLDSNEGSKGSFCAAQEVVSCAVSPATERQALLKRAYRKIDIHLLAWYAFVWMIVKMESHNVSNAVGSPKILT